MVIAHSLDEILYQRNSVVTVGTFDGIHLGHQKILSELLACKNAAKRRSVVISFHPHPREIVGRGPVGLLTTLDERLNLFETYAVDITLIIDFTFEFSRQTSLEFYERYVVKGTGVMEVIV
ncbi:MAG TPA: adenylyltransferase/cytidyltransferase family protein, partial [Bacteroidota bacterium]|nr:adenylyltransferase/cytidyltransferase family protein [Bacteroidota bacterium]